MAPHIRSATTNDAADICAVIRRSITECCVDDHQGDAELLRSWLRNKTVASVEAWLRDHEAHCIVGERDGAVHGFGMSRGDQILLCYVTPEARFTGLGKALLQTLERRAAAQGLSTLRLDSTRTAEAFYRRNGFLPTGPAVQAFGLRGQPMSKAVR
ncbi:GNAT family N-acetyltransferase [Hydrogenophaga sp. SNF1]|uniref:GNAT family N-acetyltransferase n=1 Tax=Hydrogenophaga sp. SNF1 TaxID=3098762 RepID=UPI002ACBE633|nr:GNAT family N-acetyltransferase [Hydrogenophaga sp. SNF1]WQB83554.1 GNAT family N-acetyltransferase [Hydrogenophaga sp. SNF1]